MKRFVSVGWVDSNMGVYLYGYMNLRMYDCMGVWASVLSALLVSALTVEVSAT